MRCLILRVANAGASDGVFPAVVDSLKLATPSTIVLLALLLKLTAHMPSRA